MFIERLFELLRFDLPDKRFELLEAEGGEGHNNAFCNAENKNENKSDPEKPNIPQSIGDTESIIKAEFNCEINKDVILRRISIMRGIDVLIVFINGMADSNTVNEFIIRPISQIGSDKDRERMHDKKIKPSEMLKSRLQIAESKFEYDLGSALDSVIEGMTAVFIEGEKRCLLLETRGFEKRNIGTADNETIVLGPKESFTESMRTNITLLRRIIHTKDLVVNIRAAGGMNNTKLALVYRYGTVNPKLLKELEKRLNGISVRSMLSAGVLEQCIEEKHLLPLPHTLSTERPDRAASHIMQGCVCLLPEGSPLAVVLPITLFSLMNSPEDIYLRKPLGTLLRITRYAGALISVFLPGYFLAMAMYHQGGLSTEVLSTVIASRKMVFEPISVEMILLLLVFQLIREAGLRVPGSIGQAIGIIGGLIMGQAAVAANLASSVVLIIVAVSGLGNFCIPDYSLQLAAAYFRMALVAAAWAAGLLGMVSASMIITSVVVGQKSFGVPYLSPYSPKAASIRPLLVRGDIGSSRSEDQLNTQQDKSIIKRFGRIEK